MTDYTEANIVQLSPLEHIRRRPGMYIGGTDKRALHHLLNELLIVMVEEALAKRCDHIWIELRDNNIVYMQDNGNGIPPQFIELLETIFTPGRRVGWGEYTVHGGLNGVGAVVTNALSDTFTLESCHEGVMYRKVYAGGKPVRPMVKMRDSRSQISGTTFIFHPDYSILDQNDFDLNMVEARCKELALTVPGLTIEVKDLRVSPTHHSTFHYPDGMKALADEINSGAEVFHEVIVMKETVVVPSKNKFQDNLEFEVEIAFQFSKRSEANVAGFVTSVLTTDGGTHIKGFKSALLTCFEEVIGEDQNLTWADISQGLNAAISIWHPDPQFVSNMTAELFNPEVYEAVAGIVYRKFSPHLAVGVSKNRQIIEAILEHRGLRPKT